MTALSEKTQVSFAKLGHPPSKIIPGRGTKTGLSTSLGMTNLLLSVQPIFIRLGEPQAHDHSAASLVAAILLAGSGSGQEAIPYW
jgi:hypothetical protein